MARRSDIQYRIGVDVGGTNTDAVILKPTEEISEGHNSVLAWSKVATSRDVTSGIEAALQNILIESDVPKDRIQYVSIGTTHFLNAVIEADAARLARVAVIRLAGPYTRKCPPFIDFPPHLRAIMEGHVAIIDGGLEIDGKEICPVQVEQLIEQCRIIREKLIRDVVIVGIFSPLAAVGKQEEYAKQIMHEQMGSYQVNIVCSKDVANVGLLERENAAILNASIHTFARGTIAAYGNAIAKLGLSCPMFLTQLDGTLIDAIAAANVPIRTFSNGPTNSVRGAAFLSGLDKQRRQKATIVVDVGGTSTDVGVLLPSGFPRIAAAYTEVGGVRTNFTMPDIHSIGLGGGSRVRFLEAGAVTVGPDSVGHEINTRSCVFGGQESTATDLAVAAGLTRDIGNNQMVRDVFSPEQLTAGEATIRRLVETAIDKMKTDADDVDVLLVGGGSIIVPSELRGVRRIHRPPYYDVANAVGAAIARVSGTIDRVEIPGKRDILDIMEAFKADAVDLAVAAGANRASVVIAETYAIELPYVSNAASRIVVRAVGDLDTSSLMNVTSGASERVWIPSVGRSKALDETNVQHGADSASSTRTTQPREQVNEVCDPEIYRPIVSSDGIWTLSETDLEWISEGCGILGCGGGGATYPSFLMARQALRDGHKFRVVSYDYFMKKESSWVVPCGFMGSPSVSSERIPSEDELPTAIRYLMQYMRAEQAAAIISTEIGGLNGIQPILLTSAPGFDLPVVDGDLMGRAYPWLHQVIPCLFVENGLTPAAGADGVGNCMIVPSTRDNAAVEDIFRAACTALGSSMALVHSPLRAHELKKLAICGTTSQAWRIGRAIAGCRKSKNLAHVAKAITEVQDGAHLFTGKIVDVTREVKGGFTHGRITIASLSQEEQEWAPVSTASYLNEGEKMQIPFQNENLAAYVLSSDGTKRMVCSVPDLIIVLDSQNGSSIGTQDYRYGLRVTVIGLACDPRWTSTRGLEVGGPIAFGLEDEYKQIGQYREPQSVIEEYRPAVH